MRDRRGPWIVAGLAVAAVAANACSTGELSGPSERSAVSTARRERCVLESPAVLVEEAANVTITLEPETEDERKVASVPKSDLLDRGGAVRVEIGGASWILILGPASGQVADVQGQQAMLDQCPGFAVPVGVAQVSASGPVAVDVLAGGRTVAAGLAGPGGISLFANGQGP